MVQERGARSQPIVRRKTLSAPYPPFNVGSAAQRQYITVRAYGGTPCSKIFLFVAT